VTSKVCRRCEKDLPFDMFYRMAISPDGRQPACKSCDNARKKEWDKTNPDKKKAQMRRYQLRHRVKINHMGYSWRAKNKEKCVAMDRINKARYRTKHPEKVHEHHANRRAVIRNAVGRSSPEQIRARIEYYGGKCYMCGDPYKHIDHVIPLSRGGSNWPANLRPACAPCNLRKHNKLPSEVLSCR